ncbi:hypothetical protein HMPREF9134_00370 [Porphyromonas catoniae F0037]|uniref:Uncharacterized protein n=1 Tax=Porphyromonas catoniae F0037 TaxID=1127696 RepID=L1NGJ7_9PORP|nr:hypothetical protein HMPREF9134_00370 [Porphyromonas catoniae F0037]
MFSHLLRAKPIWVKLRKMNRLSSLPFPTSPHSAFLGVVRSVCVAKEQKASRSCLSSHQRKHDLLYWGSHERIKRKLL